MFNWQHISEYINPIAFTVGFFSLRWYALCFILGFLGAFLFFGWYTRKSQEYGTLEDRYDLFLILFAGALLGGRLGYVLLYQPSIFWDHPSLLFWPYQNGQWVGISGMSFHGGLIGVIAALFFYAKRMQKDFFSLVDHVALSVPIALFFGRIGNFLNGELYGRMTDISWGMYFASSEVLRHPSALYEALGEGLLLFMSLLFLHRFARFPGALGAAFLIFYGMIRFVLEYFREPDKEVFFVAETWTLGQWYSLPMILTGVLLFMWLRKKNRDTLDE